jgi:hypothetical protein
MSHEWNKGVRTNGFKTEYVHSRAPQHFLKQHLIKCFLVHSTFTILLQSDMKASCSEGSWCARAAFANIT